MPFARHVGVELTAASDGEATGHIDIEAHHSSTPATVVAHGGVSYTLADTVGGAAVISLAEKPTPTVDMRIDYLAPATGDRLDASASVVRFGDSVAVVDVSVTDEQITAAQRALASEGVGVEPASAASIAGLRKLVDRGDVDTGEDVVCLTTGHLLKDPAAAAEAGADPEGVPNDTDDILAHLAGEDVSGGDGLLGKLRSLL